MPRSGRRIGYLVGCNHSRLKACEKCVKRRKSQRERLRYWRGSPLSAGWVPPATQRELDAKDAARYRYLRDKVSRGRASRLFLTYLPLDRLIDRELIK